MKAAPHPCAPRWPASAPGPSLGERIAIISIALLFGGGVALWLAGQLAGLAFGGVWPSVSIGDMGGVLTRLPARLDDPAAAWPRSARAALPGATAFYLTFAVLAAIVIAVATAAARSYRRLRDLVAGPSAGRAEGARWAARGELRALRVDRPVSGRLTLGRAGGQLVAAEPRQSAIVVAPTQSLKTTGLAVPAILEWDGPVLATSVKTTCCATPSRAAGSAARSFSTTRLPRPACPGADGHRWLRARAGKAHSAPPPGSVPPRRAAAHRWPTRTSGTPPRPSCSRPILFAAASSDAAMAEVVRWVDTQERDEVRDALVEAGVEEALVAAEATWRRDERQRSSIYTTSETVLGAYADPGVVQSAYLAELTPERLLDGGAHTVYLCAPAHEQQRLRPLFATLVQQVVAAVYERAAATGRPLDPPLLVVLDEAANVAPVRDLDTLASTAAGQGIQLVSVFQDLAQMRERWGERALTILNNHRAKIIGAGTSDPDTLDYVARVLGDEEVRQVSATAGQEGHASTTESSTFRTLAPPHLVRQGPAGSAVLIYGNLPPARLELRPWFRDRALRRLAAPTPSRERVA